MDLSNWKGAPRPERINIVGRYALLEPLDPARHGADLFASAQAPGADDRFRYLFEEAPADAAAFNAWIEKAAAGADPFFYAVIDKATGRAEGRQSLMRIDPVHGVIEIGNILWGPAIARSRVATEALFLFATPRLRPRLSPLRMEVQQPQRALEAGGANVSASPSKASSASTWW